MLNAQGPIIVVLTLTIAAGAIGMGVIGVTASDVDHDEFGLSIDEHVDIPSQTVTIEGSEYEISAIGRIEPGDPIAGDSSGPSDVEYDVVLYDADKDVVDEEEVTGDGSFSFETDELDPGSYLVAIRYDGAHEAVYPVVISDYTVEVDAPSEAASDESVEVTATVTEDPGENAIDEVKLIVGDEETVVKEPMTEEDGTYVTDFSTSSLPPGDYSLYVVVLGEEEVFDHPELLAFSDEHSFTIESTSSTDTPTPTATPDEPTGDDDESSPETTTPAEYPAGDRSIDPWWLLVLPTVVGIGAGVLFALRFRS